MCVGCIEYNGGGGRFIYRTLCIIVCIYMHSPRTTHTANVGTVGRRLPLVQDSTVKLYVIRVGGIVLDASIYMTLRDAVHAVASPFLACVACGCVTPSDRTARVALHSKRQVRPCGAEDLPIGHSGGSRPMKQTKHCPTARDCCVHRYFTTDFGAAWRT